MSTKIGIAPYISGAIAVADIEVDGTNISSPGEIPIAPIAAYSPEVFELTETEYLTSNFFDHRASNS